MKKTFPLLVGIVILMMITACPTPNDTIVSIQNDDKEITAFSFTAMANAALSSDVTGTISGTVIDLTVPYGTDVTALVAAFTTTGESVTVDGTAQTSGTTPNNFSIPVTYTVTAEDGSTHDYTVEVTIASNTAKEITAFSFTADTNPALSIDVIGTISSTNIDLTVPHGTDVIGLVATFSTTGSSVIVVDQGNSEQESGGSANDFSSPVIYTITAADGSTRDYIVTVSVAANTAKEITTFSFTASANSGLPSDVTSTISGTDIDLTVPVGTDVTTLVATFTTTGESVTVSGTAQISGTTANNFSSPVIYSVTAADTSTQNYTVMVSIAANTTKEITAFSFPVSTTGTIDVTGTISGNEIELIVPFGTIVKALVASFTTTGATVNVDGTIQTSGVTANDFSNPVTYTVTAEDGSTQNYTVTVNVPVVFEDFNFSNPTNIKQKCSVFLFDASFDELLQQFFMIYAQDSTIIILPNSYEVTNKFWISESPFTNAQAVIVLQWAYDNYKIVEITEAHNVINAAEVKYGGKKLIGFAEAHNRVSFSNGVFSVDPSYDDHPLVCVSWYGAVMLCNWLTEMRDGHDGNLVYEGITQTWDHFDTIENTSKNGYRLPLRNEKEYASRYLGTTAPVTGEDLDTECIYANGHYWTPENYASGAIANYENIEANQEVAVYSGTIPTPTTTAPVASRRSNALGLYDMSGNVWEWCSDLFGETRNGHGGSWNSNAFNLQVYRGNLIILGPEYGSYGSEIGFRLSRTAD